MQETDACTLVDSARGLKDILKTEDRFIALFYASWCPYCVKFLPIFKRHAGDGKRHCILVQDDQETLAEHYAVQVYPTVLFFEHARVAKRLDGTPRTGLDEDRLIDFIRQCP
jgi:thiol-disulfide isomerase/thioredoxin